MGDCGLESVAFAWFGIVDDSYFVFFGYRTCFVRRMTVRQEYFVWQGSVLAFEGVKARSDKAFFILRRDDDGKVWLYRQKA